MADVVVIEDIFAEWKARGIGTANELGSPAIKLALNSGHTELGIGTAILELDPPEITIDRSEDEGPFVGYLAVPLKSLAGAVRRLADHFDGIAPGRSD